MSTSPDITDAPGAETRSSPPAAAGARNRRSFRCSP